MSGKPMGRGRLYSTILSIAMSKQEVVLSVAQRITIKSEEVVTHQNFWHGLKEQFGGATLTRTRAFDWRLRSGDVKRKSSTWRAKPISQTQKLGDFYTLSCSTIDVRWMTPAIASYYYYCQHTESRLKNQMTENACQRCYPCP